MKVSSASYGCKMRLAGRRALFTDFVARNMAVTWRVTPMLPPAAVPQRL